MTGVCRFHCYNLVSFLRPQITTVASNPATEDEQVCFGFVKNMQQESTKKLGFAPHFKNQKSTQLTVEAHHVETFQDCHVNNFRKAKCKNKEKFAKQNGLHYRVARASAHNKFNSCIYTVS